MNAASDLDLLKRARAGDGRARDLLAERYLPLVRHIASRFGGRKSPLWDDIYATGCLGLARALNRFEPQLGYQISTYAVPVILGEIRQYLRGQGAVKMGRQTSRAVHRVRAIQAERQALTGHQPSLGEMAAEVGMDAADLAMAMEAGKNPRSLTPLGSMEAASAGDPEQVVDRVALSQAVSALPRDLQQVILLRYGRGTSQAEAGRVLGLSQSQISRREKEALARLRQDLVVDG